MKITVFYKAQRDDKCPVQKDVIVRPELSVSDPDLNVRSWLRVYEVTRKPRKPVWIERLFGRTTAQEIEYNPVRFYSHVINYIIEY